MKGNYGYKKFKYECQNNKRTNKEWDIYHRKIISVNISVRYGAGSIAVRKAMNMVKMLKEYKESFLDNSTKDKIGE